MPTKIRLARAGSKKRPYYHIVVADVRAPRDGRFIERVGKWDPMLPKDGEAKRVELNEERIKHWVGHGAVPTDRVLRFMAEAGLAERPARENPNKAKPGKKALERIEEQKQKAEDAKQAAEDAKQAEADAKRLRKKKPRQPLKKRRPKKRLLRKLPPRKQLLKRHPQKKLRLKKRKPPSKFSADKRITQKRSSNAPFFVVGHATH